MYCIRVHIRKPLSPSTPGRQSKISNHPSNAKSGDYFPAWLIDIVSILVKSKLIISALLRRSKFYPSWGFCMGARFSTPRWWASFPHRVRELEYYGGIWNWAQIRIRMTSLGEYYGLYLCRALRFWVWKEGVVALGILYTRSKHRLRIPGVYLTWFQTLSAMGLLIIIPPY